MDASAHLGRVRARPLHRQSFQEVCERGQCAEADHSIVVLGSITCVMGQRGDRVVLSEGANHRGATY
jgi:hypothetical protein